MLTIFSFLFNTAIVGSIIAVPAAGVYAMIKVGGEQIHSGHNPSDDEPPSYEFVSNYCGDYVLVRKQ